MNYYKRVNPLNTNEVYVGRTSRSILARNHRGWADFHDGVLSKKLHNVYQQLYDNKTDFIVELLESTDDTEEFDVREQYWIDFHKQKGNILLNAYPEANGNKHKSIIISSYNLDGSLHTTFQSKLQASQKLHILNTNLDKALTGVTKQTAGFMWRLGNEPYIPAFDGRVRTKTVYQYNLDGSYVDEYPSLDAACRVVGLKSGASIYYVLTGKKKTAGKFLWSYDKKDNIKI